MTDFFLEECIRRIKAMQFLRKSIKSKAVIKNQIAFFYNEEFEAKILEHLAYKTEGR